MQNKNKTLVRSMDVLQLFVEHPKLTLNEMVLLSGMPKTSIYRMLGSLEDMGFVSKDEWGRYELGLMFLQFGYLVAERLDLRQAAYHEMVRLRDEIGEAIHLVIRDGESSLYIEKLDTHHPVRLFTRIGRRAPLYAGASSRVILAFMAAEELAYYIDGADLKPIGEGTITCKEQLREAIARTRQQGYGFSRSELENYTAELSAPIFQHTGQLAGCISAAGLDVRFSEERLPFLIEQVRQAAERISLKLGWSN